MGFYEPETGHFGPYFAINIFNRYTNTLLNSISSTHTHVHWLICRLAFSIHMQVYFTQYRFAVCLYLVNVYLHIAGECLRVYRPLCLLNRSSRFASITLNVIFAIKLKMHTGDDILCRSSILVRSVDTFALNGPVDTVPN